MILWTSDKISKILIKLDELNLPFMDYSFDMEDSNLKILGKGGSAYVYAATNKKDFDRKDFAIKVIGFKGSRVDSKEFHEAVQVQKQVGSLQDNVVRIYDFTELWVTLDDEDNVISASRQKTDNPGMHTLQLQFILMERIDSVIQRNKNGSIRMIPEYLNDADEEDILKVAYDIGTALQRAHNHNVLHRDIKLENIFYSEELDVYKLGDFGIAKKTEDGFAGTQVLTKGYAAPEVLVSKNRYDNTADIYSFGMMLYVLANGLKFPESNTYSVNHRAQYQKNYELPPPEKDISDKLYRIIAKACNYNPNARYQTMEGLLLDIKKLIYNEKAAYDEEHKKAPAAVSLLLLFFGTIASDLLNDDLNRINIYEICFFIILGLGIMRSVLSKYKKKSYILSLLILVLGINYLKMTDVRLLLIIEIVGLAFLNGSFPGYLALTAIAADIISFAMNGVVYFERDIYDGYRGITNIIFSFADFMLLYYMLLNLEYKKSVVIYWFRKIYWIIVGFFYLIVFYCGYKTLGKIGIAFCIGWVLREDIFRIYYKIMNNRI